MPSLEKVLMLPIEFSKSVISFVINNTIIILRCNQFLRKTVKNAVLDGNTLNQSDRDLFILWLFDYFK